MNSLDKGLEQEHPERKGTWREGALVGEGEEVRGADADGAMNPWPRSLDFILRK